MVFHPRNRLDEIAGEARPEILRHALRLTRNLEDAEDVTQNTLMKVIQHYDSYRGESELMGWIYRITRNQAYDFFRRRRSRPAVSLDGIALDDDRFGLDMPDERPAPDERAIDDETRVEIRDAVDSLSETEKEALLLADLGSVPYQEAAALTGLSVPGFKTRRFRARRSLARRLQHLDPSGRDAA